MPGKRLVAENVYEMAKLRIAHVFDLFDHITVAFSGGKDSTVVLNLTLEEAERRGRLPLDVLQYDDEVISPHTYDFLCRTRARPGVAMRWYCLPFAQVNSCSIQHPTWHPWAPEVEHLWVRPMPGWALTTADVPGWPDAIERRPRLPDVRRLVCPRDRSVAWIMGLRAGESLNRYRAVTGKRGDNYMAPDAEVKSIVKVEPIYDWSTKDVWTAPARFGWDYNRSYDVMRQAGMSEQAQRVATPYGEQPMRNLWMWGQCWPEMWAKMVMRVPGAATAARYARGELYAFEGAAPPKGQTWEEGIAHALSRHVASTRSRTANWLKVLMRKHHRLTRRPIPEMEPDPDSGITWQLLYSVAVRGDIKRRASNRPSHLASLGSTRSRAPASSGSPSAN